MTSVRRLLKYMRPYWHQFAVGFLALILVAMANLAIPLLFRRVVALLTAGGSPLLLGLILLGAILLTLAKGVFSYAQKYLMSFVGHRVVANLRNEIFQHLQRLSLAYHESHRSGETVARITNDVNLIQASVAGGMADLLYNTLFLAGIIGTLFYLNWRLTLLTLITIPLAAWVIAKAGERIRAMSHRVQERTADLASLLQESLSGIRVVKAFTLEDLNARRFAAINEANFHASMKAAQIMATATPVIELVFTVALALVLWYAGLEVLRKALTLGDFIAFITLVGMAGTPFTALNVTFSGLQQALAAADRIFAFLDHEEEVKDAPDALVLPRIEGHVEFRNVTFGYRDGEPALAGINLEVRPGEVVALVGPSGAGKTTLVNLIPRFYDPDAGEVRVDGFDLRKVRIASLRRQIGLVPQETVLFNVSVRENIAYGKPDATDEEIIAAAKAANAYDFIMELPEGFATVIGERGASLSGGQRQRIAIARAILRDPRILILDEATSALDPESERSVQEALERLMRGRTTFVIAHRLSTIQFAQKIVVLAGGSIVEQGTHEELLAANGLYKRLYEKQLAGEGDLSAPAASPSGGESP
ncbi:MAG: ABC transporter ATP-binding protein [Bacillota bacterium]